jgi:ADP-ribose pyrophosphatase YjhB (NUDIX family)
VEISNATRQDQFKASKEVSVMAWIENQFGEVLLLKQVRGNKLWTLPGGKVRPREPIQEALKREVAEEIGLKIQPVSLLALFDRPQKAVITFLYIARIKGRNDVVSPKGTEVAAARFSSSPPRDATPSLRCFGKHVRRDPLGKPLVG